MSQNAQGGVRDSEESFYFLWISAPFSLRDLKPLMFTANLDEMGLFLFKHSVSDKARLRGQVVSYVGGNNKHYDEKMEFLFRGISRFLSAVCRRWFPGQPEDRTCLALCKKLVIFFCAALPTVTIILY